MSKKTKDFLRKIVEEDLKNGKYTKIVTRFPPEPNGFPHIGHAKSISLNFGIAKDYDGLCNLRMDDTNPTKEDIAYVEALKDAVEWLGFKFDGDVRYTSDYFETLYGYAQKLIKMGKAYVDSVDEERMKELRGTVTSAGKRSEFAKRSVEENLELLEKMKNGEFKDGEHILRAKIDMASSNMKMRDPLLYRIRHAEHFRAGNRWSIYPMYDFAHCLSDYIEGVTHSFCTLEFENNRELYDWILDTLELEPPRPYQYEFARLNINYTVMSKRKLLELVEKKIVSGWDDPRLPTIAGYKRRGYTPESILNFCESIGIAKANSIVDVSQLEFAIRDDLNQKVPRVMAVLKPLKVTIENYDGYEEIEASYYPSDVAKEGSRKLPFSKEIYINSDDFSENPPKGYFRLTPEQPVRLKYAYIIKYKELIRDANGDVVEIKAEYYKDSRSGEDRSGIKVKSAIQWVEAKTAIKAEVRIYDRLYKTENPQELEDLNPNSLQIIKGALVERAVVQERPDVRFQFEREGYFFADSVDYSDENPVFNKIVSLKDSWSKKSQPKVKKESSKKQENKQVEGKETPMSEAQKTLYEKYISEYKFNAQIANMLARDEKLSAFLVEALQSYDGVVTVANIVANEVAKEFKEHDEVKFTPADIAILAKMADDAIISSKIAKEVFEAMKQEGKNPEAIVEEKGLKQINNPDEILPIIREIMEKNADNVTKYKDGNQKLFGFFVGQVLKATGGKANPQLVNELVKESLEV
ncbi:glutamine--tRNA ligase/YqeY domain fusion protein [Sulfurimonas sp.]